MTEQPPPPIPPASPPPFPPASPPPPPEGGAAEAAIPWEDRQRLGFVPALVNNVKLFIMSPTEGFRRMKEQGDFVSPIFFAVLVMWVGTFMGQIWGLLFGSVTTLLPGMNEGAAAALAGRGVITIGFLVLVPFLAVIGLFLGAGLFHLCLMMVGGTERSGAGFEGTLRVLAYASVAHLAQVIPLVGMLIAPVWAMVLFVLGFMAVHKTSQGKAIVAVLIPLALCCACLAVVFAMGIAGVMSAVASG